MNGFWQRRLSIVSLTGSLLASSPPCRPSPHRTVVQASRECPARSRSASPSEEKSPAYPPPGSSGPVVFEVSNAGTIPHASSSRGRGLGEEYAPDPTRRPPCHPEARPARGSYEAYCPVGKGSHKMLGSGAYSSRGRAPRARTRAGSCPRCSPRIPPAPLGTLAG